MRGEHTAAAQSLERALDLAEPAGLRRLIVAHGSCVQPLLRRHSRHSTSHPAMVHQALEALEHRGERAHRAPVLLAEPLSEREQAVLHYLKAIYRKLDAAGRRDAVQRGRQLGLMP